jgi:hypothetical protein
LFVTSPSEATHALKFLAGIDLDDSNVLDRTPRESGQLKVDILITGDLDVQWIETTWKHNGSARIVVLIVCEDSPPSSNLSPQWFVLSCLQLIDFAANWNSLSSLSAEYLV